MALTNDDLPPHLRPRSVEPIPVFEELPLELPPPPPPPEVEPEREPTPDPFLRRSSRDAT
jgi:hypothetical protein